MLLLVFLCLFALEGAAITAASDDVRGMIISLSGQTLIVSSEGCRTTVVLIATTRVKDDKGLFGVEKEEMADTVLIPGLKLVVDGSSDSHGLFVAETITVDGATVDLPMENPTVFANVYSRVTGPQSWNCYSP